MQAAEGEGGGGGSAPSVVAGVAPSADEKKLIDVLVAAPTDAHLVTLLKCINGWQSEGQANLYNWSKVLERLQRVLKNALEACPRLVLILQAPVNSGASSATDASASIEKEATEQVFEVLRFTALLLQNASNKHVYNSFEYITAFLGARNDRIVFEATRVMAMLSLPPQAHRHAVDSSSYSETSASRNNVLRRRLLVVAQGRGIANSSLDIVDFLNETSSAELSKEQFVFQFYGARDQEEKTESEDDAQVVSITIPPLKEAGGESERAESLASRAAYAAADTCEQLIQQYKVPAKLRFQLYTKIRGCYALRTKATRESIVVERLYANLALFYIFSESWDVTSYIEQNSELTRAIVELVRVELYDKIPVRVRVAALQVLTALVHDRVGRSGGVGVLGRQSHVLSALGVVKGTPHGVFPSLVRFCMSELGNITVSTGRSGSTSTTPAASDATHESLAQPVTSESENDMDMSLAVAFVHATTDLLSPYEAEVVSGTISRNVCMSATDTKLCWVEAVLCLLTAVVGIQLGAAVLTENGVIPSLLHVITVPSASTFHAAVTTQCIQALETTVSNHASAAALYRDLNGVGILVDRLLLECSTVSTHSSAVSIPESKVVLLVALLVALSVSFHSQGVMSAGATSRVIREGSALSKVLVKILGHVDVFGPVVFAQAAILVSDIINNDPSSVNHVHSGGIADTLLQTLIRWDVEEFYPSKILLPPCSELIMSVPSVLNALSLTSAHAEKVAKYEPLLYLLDMFALPGYTEEDATDCFQGEVAPVVGAGIFELMRHSASFQIAAIQACIHALKKVIRFGEDIAKTTSGDGNLSTREKAPRYNIFLRMANHVADVLEPILSKSEYAVSFADRGGIQLLITLYRLVLPTTASFLSSAFSNVRDASASRVNHHPAAQSITLALRAYASQQPTVMLTTVVKELSSQLDGLQRARSVIGLPWYLSESGEGAEGVLCSLPDVELAELFADKPDEVSMASPNAGKIGPVGEYLRVLATIEWLSALLVWTMQIAQSHLQSRRWFTEFSSKPTQQVLSRLFGVDRSVQYERASLAALHKKKQNSASEPMEVEEKTAEHGPSDAKQPSGLWKVGSLLLLRFTIVMRSLLVAYGKSFLSAPLQHRRGDDSVIPLAPHALSLTTSVAQILEAHVFYIVAESRAKQIDAFVRQYYLSFLLETIVTVLFEGKKKQANTLLLVELLKPLKRTSDGKSAHGEGQPMDDVNMAPQPPAVPEGIEEFENPAIDATSLLQVIMNIMAQFFKSCLDHQSVSSVSSKVDLTSFRIAAAALRRFSDLESISASPLTAALVLNDESGDIGDIDGHFKPRALSVQLHQECVRVLFSIWSHPQFAALPVDDCILEILPIAVVILKNRLDQGDATSALVRGNSDGDFGFLSHRHGLGFGRGRGSSSFEAAIFGRRSSGHTRSRHTFIPDPAIVGSLTAMGFPQTRVEHAIRRIQINDVELAMEWILSHPDEDGNDEEKSQDEDEQDNKSADESVNADSQEDSEEKKRETALFESYSKLRDSFEEVSFRILQVQAKLRNEPKRENADPAEDTRPKDVYPKQNLVKTVAEYFVVMCERSDEEQNVVLSRVNASILGCFAPDGKSINETDDQFFTLVAHLLALLLQLHPSSRDVFLRQKPCCVDSLAASISAMATAALANDVSLSASCAPVLLALDALVIGSTQKASSNTTFTEELLHPTNEETKRTEGGEKAEASKDELLPSNFQNRLIQICLELLTILGKEASANTEVSHRELQATIAHAVMQLAAHVTLDYDIAHSFFTQGGIDLVLSIREENMFIGYQDLACTLLSQVIESPEVLEQMMEEKILRALSKLSTRSDSLSQMRITPRALLMEVAPIAARNEEIFIKALGNAVQIKKGDSGRTYVVPKKASTTETVASGSTSSAATSGHVGDEEAKEKKGSTHKIPKNHKHNIQTIATKIIEKIRTMWEVEKTIASDAGEVKKTPNEESKDQLTQPAVCVGTYLQLLVHLVTSFPICATVLAKSRECNLDGKDKFIRQVLKEFLPSKELCSFVAARKSLKEGGLYGNNSGLGADLPLAEVTSFLNHRTRARVQGAHRLLVSIGSQSGEGSKCIIMELVHLLQEWPYSVPSTDASIEDLSVRDEESLSALHAWAGLIMSILWPNGSTKGFAWDKVVPGGGLNGKHSFVTLLAEALRKVDLAHPLAHSTCSILLRPLATLTRTFVTHRVRKLLKKRNSASGTDTVADNSAAVSEPAAPNATGASVSAERTQDVSAHIDLPLSLANEALTAEVTANAEDVAMQSPVSIADDQEMREAVVDEDVSDDDESDRSSVSSHSTDEGEEEEEDDEDDEDDDEEDGDDDDEDDEDDEDEEDEEENQMRLRAIRRGGGHNYNGRRSSSRLWGSLDTDLSIIDALDEVDEEEFSYLNILDDEALFSEEQTRRARLQRNLEARRGSSRSTSSDSGNAGESSVNSLLEAFLGSPDTTEALTNAISLGEEESPFDSPSGELFRDSIFISQSQDQRGAGTFRNAVMQFIEDLPDGGDENILFESFEMGNAGSRARRDRQGNRAELSGVSITHPLLRSTGSAEVMTDTSGLRVPARLSLPRHSSLLRELQELSEHVQTQLPLSFGGGARARLGGRELLQRGGGRTRPPSRNNRLSAVSNLLSEFSLDIPTSQLSLNQSRSHRLGMRGSDRGDRDIFGGSSRSLRGEGGSANSASLWGPGGAGRNVDIRSVASRLEHRINQMYQDTTEEEPTPTARPENANAQLSDAPTRNDIVGAEEDETRPREDVVLNPDPTVGTPRESEVTASGSSRTSFVGNDEGSVSEDESRSDVATVAGDQTPGNELSSDTASVIALASTFGESTLRSPDEPDTDQMGSETEAPNSPLSHERDVEAQTSSTQFGTLPPPAPVVSESSSMLSFTLDLADLQAPPQRTAPSETQSTRGEMGDDEESKVDDAPTHPPAQDSVAGETTDLVCPEGIDPEVFASLPPDMQAEIVAQSAPPSVSTTAGNQGGSESFSQLDLDMANSSFDRETLEALPEDIRAEVLANERREREALAAAAAAPADISRAQEMDNASFVASLAPELREEILVTCDDAFLQTLPSQVRAEAMILRERAAFRTTYRERQPDAGRSGDGIGDLFQRPTLRRMLTSHGPDGVASSSRRSGRRNVYLDSNGNVRRGSRRDDDDMNGSAHAGMLRVDPDEDEDASERICDDKCVKGLLRLLYMAQSVVQNRVYQRVLANICLYPLTRESVRVNALRVITRALDRPLVLAENVDDNFPPTGLFGCTDNDIRGVKSGQVQHGIPVDAVTRLLHVLVSLAKYNPRFTVELLQPHGMRRQDLFVKSEADLTVTNESGVAVLVELLTVPIVSRNGTNLDTLLELLELVLSPLERLAKKEDANKKDTPENETQPKTNESEWVTVPVINLDARSMSSIVSVLCMDICSPQMQERTVAILKLLNRVPDNCGRVIDAIVYHASALAKTSKASFHGSSYESSAVLRSAQDELRLLRLLHTLSDICETTAAFTDYCHTIGLDPLWDQLSHSLEDARSKGGLDEKDGPVLSPLESVVAAAAAAPSTSDDENVDGMVIEGKSAGASCAMAALLARFLPMVEAFFVVNARDAASMSLQIPDSTEREEAFVANLRVSGFASTNTASTSVETPASPTPTPSEAGESMRLANFVEANRVLLNILVREKPSLLDSSLAALIKMPRCRAYLDFDNKRTYFQSAMKKLRQTALRSQGGSSSVRIPVRRDHIFEDSYYALRMRNGQELRRKLHISFTGEEGIDAGGVTREWYMILAREIFNPNYVLFTSAADSPTFQPNPLSYVNKDHLSYFEFVGKVMGKAVADGQLLDAHFTRSFYKHILQLPISYHDMEAIDPEYYRNLHSILDNAIEDLGLELTFSAEQSNFGKLEIVDLIPNGRHVNVTDENKMEYVKLVTHHRMATGIRQQIDAFLKGFHQLVPPEMISIFNENELELLISGMPEIDIDDLKANTDYANFKPTDSVIRWFWNVLYSFTHEERALFLQFVTGTSKVPLEGFKALEGMRGTQKFNIHKAYGNTSALPSAHTCFNQLDLPEYESEEKLKQCLLLAIREGSEGFGFG